MFPFYFYAIGGHPKHWMSPFFDSPYFPEPCSYLGILIQINSYFLPLGLLNLFKELLIFLTVLALIISKNSLSKAADFLRFNPSFFPAKCR